MLYVVDGMDGSGKNTTATALAAICESKGRTVKIVSHPDRNYHCGRLSARLLLIDGKPAKIFSTIFFVLNILCSVSRMKHSDTDDTIFVRYTLSAAYLPEKFISLTYKIMDSILPTPDYLFYKDADANDAIDRIKKRGEKQEVFENIDSLIKTRKKMLILSKNWIHIDADLDLKEIEEFLEKHIFP